MDGRWLLAALAALATISIGITVLGQLTPGRSCFCKLDEAVDECHCSVDSVDVFNNQKLFPVLQSLLQKDFFRYYRVTPVGGDWMEVIDGASS